MDGILLIDKKNQMTSFDVIRQLRKKLGIKKIGHAGTLDPFATGLLIILIGKATKLSDYLLNDDKTYESVFTFGSHTDTYDITGQILRESEYIPTLKDINVAMKTLESYEQEPPMYSAIKMNGQKLVDLARKGKVVQRKKRTVEIKNYKVLSFEAPDLSLSLQVSKGTYVRSVAVDLASKLNTYAFVSSLKRTQSGKFHVKDAQKLDDIGVADVISLEKLLSHFPKITVSDFIASKVKHGMLLDERQYKGETPFCVHNEKGEFLGFYDYHQENTYKPILTKDDETN
ncbi:MAG: tRNA pseudouridine(55) synthase TruB [Acholeplasmataceae bacterium]